MYLNVNKQKCTDTVITPLQPKYDMCTMTLNHSNPDTVFGFRNASSKEVNHFTLEHCLGAQFLSYSVFFLLILRPLVSFKRCKMDSAHDLRVQYRILSVRHLFDLKAVFSGNGNTIFRLLSRSFKSPLQILKHMK